MRHLFPVLLSFFIAAAALAQDGAQLYTLYCSACHGAEGEGAGDGTFPPLAHSPWVTGAPDRAIKIVLQGLHGPITVKGKTYDLEMPPQGAMLPDDQVAAILSYVRTSWGNQGEKVETASVSNLRAATSSRKGPWTAEELLKMHPLPLEKTALSDIISRSFPGRWNEMPDFSKLTPANVEEEHDGILDVSDAPFENHFAIHWDGRFHAPQDGDYEFLVDADDAATVWLEGKVVVSVVGTGKMDGSRAKLGKVSLTRGAHPIQVGFLEVAGEQTLALGWRLAGDTDFHWLSARRSTLGRHSVSIPVMPESGRPVIYRNFIDGTSPRAIGVGFPEGLNLAWSADHLTPELLWTGDFIDGAPKWLDRGTRPSPPAGSNVTKLVSERFLSEEARFRGYKLDEHGNPTFVVTLGSQTLHDSWRAGATKNGHPCLVRTLLLSGGAGTLRVPLGDFDAIESEAPTTRDNGMQVAILEPGASSTHFYIFAP